MGKNKLEKFRDMEKYPHVFQYPYTKLIEEGFRMKGKWKESFFGNDRPLVLELGCGKGEYTVSLAKFKADKNYIGIDIKGARMWTGARQSLSEDLSNVAFLRTNIELLDHFFEKGEVSEIWITFPDPQMKKINKRITSSRFLKLYSSILEENGTVHLKTDSQFLFTYTSAIAKANDLPLIVSTEDLYNSDLKDETLFIRTFYEEQWLDRGINIKYLRFVCKAKDRYIEPGIEIEMDDYRSYNRSKRSPDMKTM